MREKGNREERGKRKEREGGGEWEIERWGMAKEKQRKNRERREEREREKGGERCRLVLVIQTNLRASKVKMISNQRISRQ